MLGLVQEKQGIIQDKNLCVIISDEEDDTPVSAVVNWDISINHFWLVSFTDSKLWYIFK